MKILLTLAGSCCLLAVSQSRAADRDADPGFQERTLKEGQSYRLFTPRTEQQSYRLLVILPGGDGNPEFTPWCQAIYRQGIPDDFLVAQMIAPTWKTPAVTWPTELTPTPGMESSIEELFAELVKDTASVYTVAEGECYTLSWSSGGPAAYFVSATESKLVKGHFVAMSVFREDWLPKRLSGVRGQRYFLYHSPEDQVCPVRLAEAGRKTLEEEGAEVRWQSYPGGHGWAPGTDHFRVIREAFEWLTED